MFFFFMALTLVAALALILKPCHHRDRGESFFGWHRFLLIAQRIEAFLHAVGRELLTDLGPPQACLAVARLRPTTLRNQVWHCRAGFEEWPQWSPFITFLSDSAARRLA